MSDGEKAHIDWVNHPPHYESPSGVECIDVIEHMPYNLASAVKYIWRCGKKWDHEEDLRKAIWFLERELQRRAKNGTSDNGDRGGANSTTKAPSYSEGEVWARLYSQRASSA